MICWKCKLSKMPDSTSNYIKCNSYKLKSWFKVQIHKTKFINCSYFRKRLVTNDNRVVLSARERTHLSDNILFQSSLLPIAAAHTSITWHHQSSVNPQPPTLSVQTINTHKLTHTISSYKTQLTHSSPLYYSLNRLLYLFIKKVSHL